LKEVDERHPVPEKTRRVRRQPVSEKKSLSLVLVFSVLAIHDTFAIYELKDTSTPWASSLLKKKKQRKKKKEQRPSPQQ